MRPLLIDRKYDLARRWSNQETKRIAGFFEGEIANVSGWDDRDKEGRYYSKYFHKCTSYYLTNYPGYRGFNNRPGEIKLDLTAELPSDLIDRFDVVFNHTTLEHIFDVRVAFANLCRMSRDVVIVIVPFSQVQHESADWGDYWRFTPTCLRTLFWENSLEVVYEAESPHRDAAVYLLFVGSKHPEKYRAALPRYRQVEIAGSWIGASPIVSLFQFVSHRMKRALGCHEDE